MKGSTNSKIGKDSIHFRPYQIKVSITLFRGFSMKFWNLSFLWPPDSRGGFKRPKTFSRLRQVVGNVNSHFSQGESQDRFLAAVDEISNESPADAQGVEAGLCDKNTSLGTVRDVQEENVSPSPELPNVPDVVKKVRFCLGASSRGGALQPAPRRVSTRAGNAANVSICAEICQLRSLQLLTELFAPIDGPLTSNQQVVAGNCW